MHGDLIGADAMKTYNKDKGAWSWKIIRCNKIKANKIYPIPPEEYA